MIVNSFQFYLFIISYCNSLWLFFKCDVRFDDCVNARSQRWHRNGFSWLWSRMWLLKFPGCVKALSHTGHLYGRVFVWIREWCTRLPDCVKPLLQTWQTYGRRPVCVRVCTERLLRLLKSLLQKPHEYGFSGNSFRWCVVIWFSRRLKYFLHSGHCWRRPVSRIESKPFEYAGDFIIASVRGKGWYFGEQEFVLLVETDTFDSSCNENIFVNKQ